MRRGRPRHDDILTPREWQVLELIRQGLTNEQIAERLGISADTAKFHVSEILGKLGVTTRREAAAWRGQPRMVPASLPSSLAGRIRSASPLRLVAGAAIAAAAVVLIALAIGTAVMGTRSEHESAGFEHQTGDEALDAIIESLLSDDAAALASRFSGTAAREGQVIGGPVGLHQARPVPADEWIRRLADSARTLYAVVRDPREPYPWMQSIVPQVPRASVYDGRRDYDVLLVVEPTTDSLVAWRFSVLDHRLVDIVIDNPSFSSGPDRSQLPLTARLVNLMPSLDDQRDSFVILPPEEQWPPPVIRSPGGPAPPANVASRSFAPDGRTGNAALDEAIETLLDEDAAGLASEFPDLAVAEQLCDPDPNHSGVCHSRNVRVPNKTWTQRLAAGRRSLYAVATNNPFEAKIFLAVDAGGDAAEAWVFGFDGRSIAQLTIHPPLPSAIRPPDLLSSSGYYWSSVENVTPDPSFQYEEFIVLPPKDRLPKPPAGHDLSVRTGAQGVDRLLVLVAARDAAGLAASAASPDPLLVRSCNDSDALQNAAGLEVWLREVLPRATKIDSVARVPAGYVPASQHLILIQTELNPYRWGTIGIYEDGGRVVGVLLAEVSCAPFALYPPGGFVVPPPAGGVPAADPSRRSGIAIVDAVLDAAYAGNEAAMGRLVSYQQVPCGAQDIGPPCPQGAPAGTPVEAIPSTVCHGGFETRDTAPQALVRDISNTGLYAIPVRSPPGATFVVMASAQGGSLAMSFDDNGVTGISRLCGPPQPEWLMTGNPSFLLPPP
jgi:DNA-binding CsgD family transcriptional regulator